MSCAACSARVEKAVSSLDGVEVCSVNLLTNSMEVNGSATDSEIISAVTKAGYGATLHGSKTQQTNKKSSKAKVNKEIIAIRKRFFISLGFLAFLMYVAMGHTMWGFPLPQILHENPLAIALLQMILCIIIMVINRKFFISGTKSAINLAPNMDTLVALGSGASFVYSVALTFKISSDHTALHGLYFESAAMILVLITLGKMLEAIAKGKTTDALDKLTSLAPEGATVIRDGKEISVPISEVLVGDIFTVRPGESVAVDGIVIEGESALDESALTGESIPVDKKVGDNVYCATINRSGFLKCQATEVGDETMLSRIIKMVEDASSSKAPIAKIADKVSGIFVPTVIGISILTFIIWSLLDKDLGFSLTRAISVLVISCPCALGLATPVSIMVGSGVGARNGILFKNATSLEEAGKIKAIALDKTGTITVGAPKVTDVISENNENELLALAYSLEKQSEHPLSRAIIEFGDKKCIFSLPTTDFKAVAGNGLEGKIDGATIRGGNEAFVSQFAPLSDSLKLKAQNLAENGKTPMFFAKNDTILGIIAVADTIKPDAKEAITELRAMGIKTVMLTGDNERTARAIAKQAGVDEVIAGVLPDGKEKVIQNLKAYGKVAMVGDGINDAPALTAADTGIAIGSGTDIAIDSANVVLIKSNMADLPAAIKLSRATLNNIKLSLFWAFFYNCLGIPLAAGVLIPLGITLTPMMGAAAMSLSSFCVVTNALRLNLVKIYKKHKIKEFKPMTKTIKIEGMMCPHCEAHVKKALEAIAGVENVVPSHTEKKATLTLTSPISDEILKSTVEAQGYKVLGIE